MRRAQAAYYERRFGVKLDLETQVVATLGSKEGFANMAQAITAPGDVILVPNPTYPIHEFGFIISGAAIRHVEANNGEAFLRGIERAVKHSIPKPIAMVLSYPSNPTAMTVDLDFYVEAVQLAKKLDLIILSDVAYAELYFSPELWPEYGQRQLYEGIAAFQQRNRRFGLADNVEGPKATTSQEVLAKVVAR